MAMREIVHESPAFKVVKRDPEGYGPAKGFVKLRHGDKLGLMRLFRGERFPVQYSVGTVIGCAVENFEDPDAARERNRANGGDDHWINACGAMVTAHKRPQEVLVLVDMGMLVWIEGHHYEVLADRNENLKLVKVPGPIVEEVAA